MLSLLAVQLCILARLYWPTCTSLNWLPRFQRHKCKIQETIFQVHEDLCQRKLDPQATASR